MRGRVLCMLSYSWSGTCGSRSSTLPNRDQTWSSRQSYGDQKKNSPAPAQETPAIAIAIAMALASSTSLCSPPLPCPRLRRRYSAAAPTVTASPTTQRSDENIVIVGAGVAGLATALALRRLGVGATVLEQGATLRAGGTSLTLFKNGWRVLDAIGVADELRAKYLRIQGCVPPA
jgi:hypothetical protein